MKNLAKKRFRFSRATSQRPQESQESEEFKYAMAV